MSRWLTLILFGAAVAHAEVYCFGFLNAHPDRKEIPNAEAQEIQKGHMAHLNRMGKEGHLLAAGPMMTQGGPRGIVIFRCKSMDEARQWTSLDPAVQNKRLVLDVYRWQGPDGLGEPLMSQLKADPNTKINMIQLPMMVLRRTVKWTGDGPAEVLGEHANRVMGLIQQGKIRAAGPFMDGDGKIGTDPLGVYIFSAMTLDEAMAIVEADPLVKQGYGRIESHMWYVAEGVLPKTGPDTSKQGR